MKLRLSRELQFEEEFQSIYKERWPALKSALLSPAEKTTLKNPFGLQDYSLDPASLAPVKALRLESGVSVADLCASPGGKSLAGIFQLMGEGSWACNDLSPARATRLRAVMHDTLPPEILTRVRVTCSDASRWGLKYQDTFDRVLVDAPCSGERHMLAAPAELARWSLKGIKRLVVRQHALLCAGLDSVKDDGIVVYSTCALHPMENDGVIAKLLKSREGKFEVLPTEGEGEATEYGRIILPDVGGFGPIYYSAMRKR